MNIGFVNIGFVIIDVNIGFVRTPTPQALFGEQMDPRSQEVDNCSPQQPVYSSIQIPYLTKNPSSGQHSMVCACYIFNPQKVQPRFYKTLTGN